MFTDLSRLSSMFQNQSALPAPPGREGNARSFVPQGSYPVRVPVMADQVISVSITICKHTCPVHVTWTIGLYIYLGAGIPHPENSVDRSSRTWFDQITPSEVTFNLLPTERCPVYD
jgi:hypothetical protein